MNTFANFDIMPLGDRGILIRWDQLPSDALLEHLLWQKEKLVSALAIEVVHTYNEILLKESPETITEEIIKKLLQKEEKIEVPQSLHYEIPVCYGGEYGEDLRAFAKAKQCTPEEVIGLHTQRSYRLYFMGFLPGFLYLEGLDKRLHHPRKATPSLHMTSGSVAIGGAQTGIYPQESPGGWHCIGRTPISLFDVSAEEPSPFKAGDMIQFKAIKAAEFSDISNEVKAATYRLKATPIDE
tara:strand:- start:86 stop:802 length:717 start_codon:yes stop_codon:yes gene_type:complete